MQNMREARNVNLALRMYDAAPLVWAHCLWEKQQQQDPEYPRFPRKMTLSWTACVVGWRSSMRNRIASDFFVSFFHLYSL